MDARSGFEAPARPRAAAWVGPLLLPPMLVLSLLAGRALAGSWLFGEGPLFALAWGFPPAAFSLVCSMRAARARGAQRALALGAALGCALVFALAAAGAPSLYPVG